MPVDSDNMTISTSGGSETVASDYVGGVQLQRGKLVYGPAGTNSGDVQEANASTKGPLPVAAYLATDYLMEAGLGLAYQYASFTLTADGTIVTATAQKYIKVVSLAMTIVTVAANDDETYIFRSGTGGTAKTGLFGTTTAAADAVIPVVLPFNPAGWFKCDVGELLELELNGTAPRANGCLTYVVTAS